MKFKIVGLILFFVIKLTSAALGQIKPDVIMDGVFVSEKFGISIPVDDTWHLPVVSAGKVSPLTHRISKDQVLTITFSKDPFEGSCREHAKSYLDDLKASGKNQIRKYLSTFKNTHKIESFCYETESKRAAVGYRYAWFHFKLKGEVVVVICTMEATEDQKYMDKAYDILRGAFFPGFSPVPSAASESAQASPRTSDVTGPVLVAGFTLCLGAVLLWTLLRNRSLA